MHNQVDNMSPYGNIWFLVPSIEIYMPISPKYTLFILGEETSKLKPDLSTIQASDELIEFVNYLQIGSACKQVVSKNNDFNFAKKILSEYEHLKTEQINKFIIQ